MALSNEVTDNAAAYVAYVNMARNMKPDYLDGSGVQSKLQQGAAFEPRQLTRGAVAYAAIIAMQTPEFRQNLDKVRASAEARNALLREIYANPSAATGLPGADIAIRKIIEAMSRDGDAIYAAGARVKQSAYDIQHSAWSKETVPARDTRLTQVKLNSSQPQSINQDDSSALMNAALSGEGIMGRSNALFARDPVAGGAVKALSDRAPTGTLFRSSNTQDKLFEPPYTQAVNNAVAIAALALIGSGNGQNASVISSLLDDGLGSNCLGLTKLNLYQCLAVAKPQYEDVFCIGQHELMDTGTCIGRMASPAISAQEAAIAQAVIDKHDAPPPPPTKGKKGKKGKKSASPSGPTSKKHGKHK